MSHDIPVRTETRRFVHSLAFDFPLDEVSTIHFGIDSDAHADALHAVLLNRGTTKTAEEAHEVLEERIRLLNDAYAAGPRLNALVKLYAPEYTDHVKFETSWDKLFGRTGANAARLQQEAERKYSNDIPDHAESEEQMEVSQREADDDRTR